MLLCRLELLHDGSDLGGRDARGSCRLHHFTFVHVVVVDFRLVLV